jgi:hypothetical protein
MQNRKSIFVIILGVVVVSVAISFLYSRLVIEEVQEKFKECRRTIHLTNHVAQVSFELSKDSYFLRTKHTINENQSKEIFVNGSQVIANTYSYIRRRGIIETSHIYLPKEIIKFGINHISISFFKSQPPDLGIILTNYRKKINNNIYIIFFDSANLPSGRISFKTMATSIIIVSFFFLGIIFFLSRFLSLSINKLLLYQVYSSLPFLIFLSTLWIGFYLSRIYRVVISPGYFLIFGFLSFFLTESMIILIKLLKDHRKKIEWITSPKAKDFLVQASSWLKLKEFSDRCILLSMVLLIMGALLLTLHLDFVAEKFVNVAYLSLVIGVVIKFLKLLRAERWKV